VNCTTAAQYFHVLRRQAVLLVADPLPLIILTPKSLLRHPFIASSPNELATGRWMPVIDDQGVSDPAKVTRLVMCSGKVAVDLLTHGDRPAQAHVAVCRVEQLYPFPAAALSDMRKRYSGLKEIVWMQEEPENMGAWDFVRAQLEPVANGLPVSVVARPRSSSPAEGSAARHAQNQERLIAQAWASAPPQKGSKR
jgi:2-oxoglutarate dehydrogenase E1 component